MGANVPVASPRPSAGHFLLPHAGGAGQPLAEVFERDAGTSGAVWRHAKAAVIGHGISDYSSSGLAGGRWKELLGSRYARGMKPHRSFRSRTTSSSRQSAAMISGSPFDRRPL